MTDWKDVGALADVPLLGARKVRTATGCVALFRGADDRVFALDDRCPHRGGPLSEGIVHDGRVTCPLHNWVIDLTSGKATGADVGATRTHAVEVVDGRLMLDFSALSARKAG
ncbi:MAG: nitrite reductase small subunit NirD [Hyphomicrobiales bacterium]|nr:nitrite reductase small subunit NirD [Hyphomicrobiales bacterium]